MARGQRTVQQRAALPRALRVRTSPTQKTPTLRVHHTRDVAHFPYGTIQAVPVSRVQPHVGHCGAVCADPAWHEQAFYDTAYAWLAAHLGFWPLFCTVGTGEAAEWATGYAHQFRRANTRAGESRVLASFTAVPPGAVFLDDSAWTAVLCHVQEPRGAHPTMRAVPDDLLGELLRPGRSAGNWWRCARRDPTAVQCVVPMLDVRQAQRLGVRNARTRELLIARGFAPARIGTRRMRVDP